MGDLRERRETVVRAHMESENRQDFEATMGTFGHPRYELVATGQVYDCRMVALFFFDDDRIVCERVYFDQATILRQLGLVG